MDGCPLSPPRRRQPDYDRVVNFTGILLKGGCTTSAAAGAAVLSPDTVSSSLSFIPLMRCFLSLSACFLFALFMFFIGHFVGCWRREPISFSIYKTLLCGACYVGSPGIGADVCCSFASLYSHREQVECHRFATGIMRSAVFCLCACIQISSAFAQWC